MRSLYNITNPLVLLVAMYPTSLPGSGTCHWWWSVDPGEPVQVESSISGYSCGRVKKMSIPFLS